LGNCTLFWQPPLQATYRRKGQRGPLAGALVRADLPDRRTVLESLIGELVEFHARPSEPPATAGRPDTLAWPKLATPEECKASWERKPLGNAGVWRAMAAGARICIRRLSTYRRSLQPWR
jgi:hypothetical protein